MLSQITDMVYVQVGIWILLLNKSGVLPYLSSPPQSSVFRKVPVQNMFNFVYECKMTSHIFQLVN